MSPDQLRIDGTAVPVAQHRRRPSDGPLLGDPNPCVVSYGPGPAGATCRGCAHLFRQGGTAGSYLKCEQRPITRGPATDHRAGWPACSRYDARG